eukprot:TRINITY_DN22806_c0_g2_i3.p1 TRINITY_DN22806_c0_g2~~TRINITY_DN22806_c0_g2_i3.p1  ORF type:complete len:365 (+),score=100.25 TRINITY_DN22806_c0_g2_i3:92-1096(+)
MASPVPSLDRSMERPSSWPVRHQRRHAATAAFNSKVIDLLTNMSDRLQKLEARIGMSKPPGLNQEYDRDHWVAMDMKLDHLSIQVANLMDTIRGSRCAALRLGSSMPDVSAPFLAWCTSSSDAAKSMSQPEAEMTPEKTKEGRVCSSDAAKPMNQPEAEMTPEKNKERRVCREVSDQVAHALHFNIFEDTCDAQTQFPENLIWEKVEESQTNGDDEGFTESGEERAEEKDIHHESEVEDDKGAVTFDRGRDTKGSDREAAREEVVPEWAKMLLQELDELKSSAEMASRTAHTAKSEAQAARDLSDEAAQAAAALSADVPTLGASNKKKKNKKKG